MLLFFSFFVCCLGTIDGSSSIDCPRFFDRDAIAVAVAVAIAIVLQILLIVLLRYYFLFSSRIGTNVHTYNVVVASPPLQIYS
jgi:hypothetical protein